MKNYQRYKPFITQELTNRTWPDKRIEKAPRWCSVDLRDGNQALETPMCLEKKLEMFKFLVEMGFKEIEIGFPAASDTEFEFTRALIEGGHIPDDVTVQVLTQSRVHIIEKTFEALLGAKNAVVHLYNSTSVLQREVVFKKSKEETIALAVFGAKLMESCAKKHPQTNFTFEYSPESFTGTELDFAVQVCNAVIEVWQPTPERKVIINLPSTVELNTPNVYADQIEYMHNNLTERDSVVISLHAHNDRGTAVAATELALLAGAQRVEGTLFGNGERTGNADILTIAMNLYTHGIDPCLDFSDINKVIEMYESTTGMSVPPRHPYAGELVYTAFSGSHQDAIRKGMEAMKAHEDVWAVPYLPIDPKDVGRSYDPIIRINSQSGKGGVAFILEQHFGLYLPKAFQKEAGDMITGISDHLQRELTPEEIYEAFMKEFVDIKEPLGLNYYKAGTVDRDWDLIALEAEIMYRGETRLVSGESNGVIASFCKAAEPVVGFHIDIMDYRGHSMGDGTEARAISYIQVRRKDGKYFFGAGTSRNVTKASLRAVVSAVNKMILDEGKGE